MTLSEALHSISARPDEALEPDVAAALRSALERYPYFALPAALLLRAPGAVTDPNERRKLQARVAVLTADKAALASLAAKAGDDPAYFYPPAEAPAPVTTDKAIDTFLNTYGNSSPEEDALLERLIFNPVPDYADVLGAKETPLDSLDISDLVPAASEAPKSDTKPAESAPEPPAPASNLSENLARIFIARGNYERALEILTDLAQRQPDRNPYYADQARFLRKLLKIKNLSS